MPAPHRYVVAWSLGLVVVAALAGRLPAAQAGAETFPLTLQWAGFFAYCGDMPTQPVYDSVFKASSTCRVGFNFFLGGTKKSAPAPCALRVSVRFPDGSERTCDYTEEFPAKTGWVQFDRPGLGAESPGFWGPGEYKVEVFMNGRKYVSSTFTMY